MNLGRLLAPWTPRRTDDTLVGSHPGLRSLPGKFSPTGGQRRAGSICEGDARVVKLTLREKETAQEAVRRFRKLVERSGIKKEIRVREFYEKPSETRRRARLRAQRRARRDRLMGIA